MNPDSMAALEWFWSAAILYVGAFVFALYSVARGQRYPRLVLLALVAGGFVFQTLALYMRGLRTMSCPLGNGFEVLQFIAWTMVLTYLVIGPAFRMSLLGFFTSGLAAAIALVTLLIPGLDGIVESRPLGNSPFVEAHAALAIFSYGMFGMLALTSAMYLLQNYGLKRKRWESLFRFLPAIWELDVMNRRLLIAGATVLTLAIAVGSRTWHLDAGEVPSLKLVATIGVWAAYIIVLILRMLQRMHPRGQAWACLVLFILALVSLGPVSAARDAEHTSAEEVHE